MADEQMLETDALSIGLAQEPVQILLTPHIGVIGVGGAGGNAVNNMIEEGLDGVTFFVANTDAQALSKSMASNRIQLGVALTRGLGAGANPVIGQSAAEESAEKIKEYLSGLHLLFITSGMGGGTGTGASPVIAKLAKELGILTVGVVSKPFKFEGPKRTKTAEKGILEFQKYVDALLIVPNQNLFRVIDENTTVLEAFKIADGVLCQGVRSLTDLIANPGKINLDFADVQSIVRTMGRAMMGTGEASGENRALLAAEKAIDNPLLDNSSMKGAKGVLLNVSGGGDMALSEINIVAERITAEVPEEANIIVGTCFDETLSGKIRVSVLATGLPEGSDGVSAAVIPAPLETAERTVQVPPVAQPKENTDVQPDLMPCPPEQAPVHGMPPVEEATVSVLDTCPGLAQSTFIPEDTLNLRPAVDVDMMPEERGEIKREPKPQPKKEMKSNLFDWGSVFGKTTPEEKQPAPSDKNKFDLPDFLKRK